MAIETFPKGYGARKRRSQKTAFGIFKGLSLFIVLVLFAILGFIIYRGAGVINWTFLTEPPSDGMTSGGIFPAIIGTLLLMAGSAIVAFPVGIMSGIYMNEYASKGWVVKFIRLMTKLGEKLHSHKFRHTVQKAGEYWRLLLFGFIADTLGLLLPWYALPYITMVLCVSLVFIEMKSVFEHYKRRKKDKKE